jgi:hypothetical protein
MQVWPLFQAGQILSYGSGFAATAKPTMENKMTTLTKTGHSLRGWLFTLGTAFVAARRERARWGAL